MIRITDLGYKIATTTHDEVVVVTRQDEAEVAFEACKAEMERPPAWLPDLPLKVEGGISERYEK
jgi:DNA polymerase I-like protein with 3'-5' exonuclease and polymerase domains